ncbi:ABC transporter substrate-binding protein [Methylobacter sp. S3L5C]|uniref:ABC transporter substrate-binding protein n=1 Tax=Methylobacter sp. S3L5C TaxID=2839024 RepID=UPI001FAD7FBE|nr:ABC transporter substrate-binding protein [Methylobacter sp. S3L5C]UOA07207.1 ABC transporter substrate-binding protein [Methylobacter sp. S3L5C]
MILKNMQLATIFVFCLFATIHTSAQAESAATAKQVVEKFQTELIAVMKNGKQLGYAGRYDKLNVSVSNSHDLTKIARIVVGKEWEKLSEVQQQKLVDVFIRLSIASYAYNFKDFSGEAFVFDSEEETTRGGVVVHSHLIIPDDKPVKFDYMLKEKGDSWRIINIIANGVSDLALKRSEYTTILQREGFDALITKINEKIDNYSKL